jgi:hypothetical protein
MEEREKPQPVKWPFDPMQPGDHEPVRLPEDSRPPEPKQKQPEPKRK